MNKSNLAALILMAASALAQASSHLTEGEVRKVDKAAGKITLRHGEIKSIEMPAMTMVFQVKDASLLDQFKTGDKVRFAVEKNGDGPDDHHPRGGAVTRAPFAALLFAVCLGASAAPMGFKDSTMAMADLGPNWREAWVNHAVTPRDAFGAGALYMRSDDKARTRELAELNYTRLLLRWNLPHAQANAWLFAGLGTIRGNDFGGQRALAAPGLQLDYETTRVYVAATGRLYRARGINHDYGSLRAGFAFIEADYDDTQPWLIVEARRMRALSAEVEITPMLRFINKRFFAEVGANQHRQGRFNLMVVF